MIELRLAINLLSLTWDSRNISAPFIARLQSWNSLHNWRTPPTFMWDLNILEKPTSKSKHSIRRAVNHFCAGCKKNNCPCMQIEVGLSGEGWMYVKFKFYFYLCSYLKSIFVTGFLARKKWHRHINYWRFSLLRTSKKFREKSFLSHRPKTRKKNYCEKNFPWETRISTQFRCALAQVWATYA